MAELIGERFEVRLDRKLGVGGFGEVFFALDRSASQTLGVAAKRGSTAELRVEARMLEQVAGHPSVIGLIAFEEVHVPGPSFLFLEMCSGGELFERVSDGGPLSERAALPIAKGIAEALRHCLSRGVVHRNVGLENVMLSAEDPNALKLIDFNLACMVPLAPDGSIEPVLLYDGVGAPTYMAPELWFASSGYHAPPVDCWAYGVLVFTLLSGFPPFEAASTAGRYAGNWRWSKFLQGVAGGASACDALYGMYNRPCPFSPPARQFCDGLLVIDANDRATLAQCLYHPWLTSQPAAGPTPPRAHFGSQPLADSSSGGDGAQRASMGGKTKAPPRPDKVELANKWKAEQQSAAAAMDAAGGASCSSMGVCHPPEQSSGESSDDLVYRTASAELRRPSATTASPVEAAVEASEDDEVLYRTASAEGGRGGGGGRLAAPAPPDGALRLVRQNGVVLAAPAL
mmetsp:Transcript_4509/g.14529  ORF Transcript_4509/g.14529 Transcript_4509/m.14529 type:complete len:457 (+) Transcript_4509:90-1460(+)